ncbi:MAG: zinc ribbon domain-containing protein [Promethearchaeota archaeon]
MTIKCPHCGESVPLTQFCIKCGKKLDIDSSRIMDQSSLTTCPHCGMKIPETDWCIYCGMKQKGESSPEQNQVAKTSKCPLCRKEVPATHNFCHLCGGKLKKITVNDQERSIFCNRCWKPNPLETEYCIHCGLKLQIEKGSKLLEEPFQGYQLDLSHFFQPVSFPLATLRQSLTSSKNFPLKGTVSYSKYFGVTKSRKASLLYRNVGGFDSNNLLNYLGTFILMLLIYIFWYSSRYANLVQQIDPVTDGILILFFGGGFLTTLLMIPIWLSTFMLYRTTGHKLNYRIDSSRVFITAIFNLIWVFVGFGPIMLQLGDFKDPQDHVLVQKSFIRGIAWGAVFSISCTVTLALLSLTIIGIPGMFAGFLFQDYPIKGHLFATYFGATWISIIILLPFGDYFDKVIKRWNQIGYFILLAIGLLLLIHSFNLIGLLTQNVYRA